MESQNEMERMVLKCKTMEQEKTNSELQVSMIKEQYTAALKQALSRNKELKTLLEAQEAGAQE